MAGLAFSNSQVHIGHAMAHSFAAIFPKPHGELVGLFLKYVTQYLINNPNEPNETIEIYSNIAKKLGWAKWSDEAKKAAYIIVDKIAELQEKVDFKSNLRDIGINKEDFEANLDKLIGLCYQDPSSVMAPRTPNKEEFKKLYTYAFEGKDIDF
jgi:alcohol dehydrogenase class IV